MSEVNGKTADEIKADIERKRSEMSEKIDTIQDRFRPDNLKHEVRGVAQDVLKESSDVLKEYLRTNAQDMTRAVGESFKRNPVPTALMALGLGWLVYSSVSSRDERDYGRAPMRSRYDGGYEGYGQRAYADRGYGDRYYAERGYAERGYAGYGYEPRGRYGSESGYAQWEEDVHRRLEREQRGSMVNQAVDKVKDVAQNVGDAVSERVSRMGEQASQMGEPLAEAGSTIRERVNEFGERIGEGVSTLGERAGDFGNRMGSRAEDFGERMGERVGDFGNRVSEMGTDVRDQAGRFSGQVRAQAGELSDEARYQMMRAQEGLSRTLDDNPLSFGAVALLAGIAIGMALPSTRRESEWMGETRDRLVERGQQMAAGVVQEVKQVASEVAPQLQETVKQVADDVAPKLQETVSQVVDNLTQAGQQVGAQVAEGVKKATDVVTTKAEEAASTVAASGSESKKSS